MPITFDKYLLIVNIYMDRKNCRYTSPIILIEEVSLEEGFATGSNTSLIFKGPNTDAPLYEEFIINNENVSEFEKGLDF